MNDVVVRRVSRHARPEVFEQIARIHQREIEEGFLASFRTEFLARLYRAIAASPNTFLYAAVYQKRIIGFIAGTYSTGRFYIDFLRMDQLAVVQDLLPVLLSVEKVKKVAETLLYPQHKDTREAPDAEILNFCTSRDYQGLGVGSKLFKALCDEFARNSVDQIKIVTGENQRSAQAFYEHKGATLDRQINIHQGQTTYLYLYDIPPIDGE